MLNRQLHRKLAFFLLLPIFATSSCTSYVYNLGRKKEAFNSPDRMLLAADGSMLLDCQAQYEMSKHKHWTARRFVQLEPGILNAALTAKPTRILAPEDIVGEDVLKEYPVLLDHVTTRTIVSRNAFSATRHKDNRVVIAIKPPEKNGFKVIPEDFNAPDVDDSLLPEIFKNNVKGFDKSKNSFDYELDGEKYKVEFKFAPRVGDYNMHEEITLDDAKWLTGRTERKWWGNPLQILFPPAVAADAVGTAAAGVAVLGIVAVATVVAGAAVVVSSPVWIPIKAMED